MTATHSGGGDPASPRFRPIVRRANSQEQVVAWGLIAFGVVGLLLGLALTRYLNYRAVLVCAGAAVLCFLMGYQTLRPRTVFDRSGIHTRTLARSHDIDWPGSRSDFAVGPSPRSTLGNLSSGGPSVHVTVHSNGDAVELGGMTTRAITETEAHRLMEAELDEIWDWAVTWKLVLSEDPGETGPGGGGAKGLSHP